MSLVSKHNEHRQLQSWDSPCYLFPLSSTSIKKLLSKLSCMAHIHHSSFTATELLLRFQYARKNARPCKNAVNLKP